MALSLLVVACHGDIYVRDGVTDGNRFYISPNVMMVDDPVTQSWIAYSLTKSVCQLEIGGDNPARASSFHCEFTSRQSLHDEWVRQKAQDAERQDGYLDALLAIEAAGFLDEYVVRYHGKRDWYVPAEVDLESFNAWRHDALPAFKPETRVVGTWSYR